MGVDMAAPNPAICWGVRFNSATYTLKVAVDGGGASTLTFPSTGSLDPATDYFMTGDGTSVDLLKILTDTLRTHASLSNAVAALSPSTLKVQIVSDPGPVIQVNWADGTLPDHLFGFDGNTSSAAVVAATEGPWGLWLPGRPPSTDSRDRERLIGGVARSVSGRTSVTRIARHKERDLGWVFVPQSKTLIEYAGAEGNQSTLEFAWVESIGRGYGLRYYATETATGTQVYTNYVTRDLEAPMMRGEAATRFDVDLRLALISDVGTTVDPAPGGGL